LVACIAKPIGSPENGKEREQGDDAKALSIIARYSLPPSPMILGASSSRSSLTYWWTFTVVFGGQPVLIHSRHVQNRSRLIVAFARPPVRPAARSLADVIEGGGREKIHHDWGQGEAEARYLLTWLTEPGNMAVDPFCGGGTIPAVCKGLGRNWLATERDKATAMIARRRLSQ
jgi:hypothetical protein